MMKIKQEADGAAEVSEGKLVWYNERKGYGFVRIGYEEVFLHRSTLDRFGLVRLLNGDHVTVSLSTNEHGRDISTTTRYCTLRVETILRIERFVVMLTPPALSFGSGPLTVSCSDK